MTLLFGLVPKNIKNSICNSGAVSNDQGGNYCKVVREA